MTDNDEKPTPRGLLFGLTAEGKRELAAMDAALDFEKKVAELRAKGQLRVPTKQTRRWIST
jgi:hypothetical protein